MAYLANSFCFWEHSTGLHGCKAMFPESYLEVWERFPNITKRWQSPLIRLVMTYGLLWTEK